MNFVALLLITLLQNNEKTAIKERKESKGISPKIAELLHSAKVTTWQGLADTSIEQCQQILHNGGKRFVMHNPSTWPQQAGLAADGQWQELLKLQQSLKGGRKV